MYHKIEPFSIYVYYYGKQYRAKVEQTLVTDLSEKFKISGRYNSIEIVSDRPYLRRIGSKNEIQFQPLNLKQDARFLAVLIIEQIRRHISDLENPPVEK